MNGSFRRRLIGNRFRTTYQLAEADRTCRACSRALHEIGEDVREELERIETVVVHKIVCKKYGCRDCETGVVTAPCPDRPIEKGILGRGFLATVLVERFANHMPYHRLEKNGAEGIDLSRSVLQRSASRTAELLEPIAEQIRREARVLPKSPIGKAILYALRQWDALCRYIEDGRLAIDNNVAERALRPFAVGRKNWLFFQQDTGGKTAAILATLIHSARAIGLDAHAYLRDVLVRIAHESDVAKLTPAGWREHFEAEVRERRESVLLRLLAQG